MFWHKQKKTHFIDLFFHLKTCACWCQSKLEEKQRKLYKDKILVCKTQKAAGISLINWRPTCGFGQRQHQVSRFSWLGPSGHMKCSNNLLAFWSSPGGLPFTTIITLKSLHLSLEAQNWCTSSHDSPSHPLFWGQSKKRFEDSKRKKDSISKSPDRIPTCYTSSIAFIEDLGNFVSISKKPLHLKVIHNRGKK